MIKALLLAGLAFVCSAFSVCASGNTEDGLVYEIPPGCDACRKSELFKKGFLDASLPPWNVKGDGKTDVTAGLQRAIDDAYDYDLAVYLREGTYLVSDTLRLIKKVRRQRIHSNVIVGSRAGSRPVLQLSDRSAGFQGTDAETSKAVLHFWTQQKSLKTKIAEITSSNPVSVHFKRKHDFKTGERIRISGHRGMSQLKPGAYRVGSTGRKSITIQRVDGSPVNGERFARHRGGGVVQKAELLEFPKGKDTGASSGYNQLARHLEIKCGVGNPGCVGVRMHAAQGSEIDALRVDMSSGGFAGVYNLPGRGWGIRDIEVIG